MLKLVNVSLKKKLFLMLLGILFCDSLVAFQVFLSLPDAAKKIEKNGKSSSLVSLDQSFAIVIEIKGDVKNIEQVDVSGLNAFKVEDQSSYQSSVMINNETNFTNTIQLQVKALKPGVFKIGPVKVKAEGAVAHSDAVECIVQPEKDNVKKQQALKALEVELIPSKKEVYWGESFDVTIRYLAHDAIYQLAPEIPEQAHFFKKEIKNKGWREILRNGQRARVYEQVVTYLPVKAGAATIGPMPIHYTVPAKERKSRGGIEDLFNFHMGPRVEQKESQAPAVNVLVKSLPKTQQKTSLVGVISNFEVTVDKPTAQVNEPIKLLVHITGKGNLELTEEIPLKLDKGCKIFKAKTSMQDVPGGTGFAVKTLEYVLQVNVSGRVELPAQQLYYFDPDIEEYKTITSQPIELFLTGDAVAAPSKTVDELAKDVMDDNNKPVTKHKEIAFVFETAGSESSALSWWFFLILMILPLLLHVQWFGVFIQKYVLNRLKKKPNRDDLLKLAEKELDGIVAANKPEKLYQFFIKHLARIWDLHEQDVSERTIEQALNSLGWTEDRIFEFINYFNMCASLHFTKQSMHLEAREALLKKAQYWVLLFSK